MKRFKQLEVPLLLLIIASFAYETLGLAVAIIFVALSLMRLYLNYVLFEEIPEDFEDEDGNVKPFS
jgi:hypothetical protein